MSNKCKVWCTIALACACVQSCFRVCSHIIELRVAENGSHVCVWTCVRMNWAMRVGIEMDYHYRRMKMRSNEMADDTMHWIDSQVSAFIACAFRVSENMCKGRRVIGVTLCGNAYYLFSFVHLKCFWFYRECVSNNSSARWYTYNMRRTRKIFAIKRWISFVLRQFLLQIFITETRVRRFADNVSSDRAICLTSLTGRR